MTGPAIIHTAEPFFFPGNGIGCLLIHGFTGTPKEMLPAGEYLSNLGYTVLGIRLSGHATKLSDMDRVNWHDWMASVEDGVNLLKASTKQIFLIGLSMGGLLSLASASIFDVSGVVAMSTPFYIKTDWRLRFVKIIRYIKPQLEKGSPDWRNPDAEITHISYPTNPSISIPHVIELLGFTINQLPEITAPVLLVNSEYDFIAPPDHAVQYASRLSNTDVETLTLTNSGHVITKEPEQDILFDAINRFIKLNN